MITDTLSRDGVCPLQAHGSTSTLYRFSWLLIVYTLVIIAWGAWVRISGSGDGCGEHWPLCHGAAIPFGATRKTWIEVSHRYSTALFGVLIVVQIVLLWRNTESKSAARRWVIIVLLFTLLEALIGRLLVKEGLVNESLSLQRLIVMPLHLVNTSLLLFSQVITAESFRFGGCTSHRLFFSKGPAIVAVSLWVLLTTGAVAALGSHLLPAESLLSGFVQDFDQNAHLAVRLRLLHPMLGLAVPGFLYYLWSIRESFTLTPTVTSQLKILGIVIGCMIVIGISTLVTLAPTWLKLLHLTLANVIVILASRLIFHYVRQER